MQLALHATRRISHSVWRLVQAMTAPPSPARGGTTEERVTLWGAPIRNLRVHFKNQQPVVAAAKKYRATCPIRSLARRKKVSNDEKNIQEQW